MATNAPAPEPRGRFRVGWGDIDGNAHMANTAFLDHAADARFFFFADRGFTGARFATERVGPVIVRDELTYRRELRLGEEFSVEVRMAGLSRDGCRFRIENTFRTAAGDLVATVRSDGTWFDLERRRPRLPPPDLDAIQRAMPRSDGFAELPNRMLGGMSVD